jgi:hypothetical protein
MKPFTRIFVLCLLIIVFSCQKGDFFQSPCKDCVTEEPVEAVIDVKVEPLELLNYIVSVNLYEGNVEDSILMNTYKPTSSPLQVTLPVNKLYTFVANYYSSGNYYKAISSVTPRVKYEKFRCVNACYIILDNVADLRLKYY